MSAVPKATFATRTYVLRHLVELDRETRHEDGIRGVFGDGILCRSNDIFRRVRHRAHATGIRFVLGHTRLSQSYDVFALMALQDILTSRTIPLTETCSPLQQLVSRHVRFRCSGVFLLKSIRRNYALHETAHCIASDVLPNSIAAAATSRRDFVLESLLAESFASAIEAAALATVSLDRHALFLMLNSYLGVSAAIRDARRKLVTAVGNRGVIRLLFAAFASVNLGMPCATGADIRRWMSLVLPHAFRDADILAAIPLFQYASHLNPSFLDDTNTTYFSAYGVRGDYRTLLPADGLHDDRLRTRIAAAATDLVDLLALPRPTPS